MHKHLYFINLEFINFHVFHVIFYLIKKIVFNINKVLKNISVIFILRKIISCKEYKQADLFDQ